MNSLRSITARSAALAAGLAGSVFLTVLPARAQQTQTDPHWQAWLGCWQPATTGTRQASAPAQALLVCVVPAAGSAGVDVVTVADTQVVSRERIEATGERHAVTRDGCTGWESAEWSALGERVFLRSELACQGNAHRRSSGLMALSAEGDWLDVRAVSAGKRSATRVLRYSAAPLPASLPTDVAAALRTRTALRPAPLPVTEDLTMADVAEASRRLDAGAVQAWLVETDQDFGMNAARLVEAKRAGVSDDVIDVMVALSYPGVFTVNPASGGTQIRPQAETAGVAGPYAYQPPGWGGYYYSPYGWDAWWPYGYNPYSPFYSPYGGYGYAPWYGGYGWGYGGRYYGGGGVVIAGGGASISHGQIVKGLGYTAGGSGGSGRQAKPQSAPSTSRTSERREGGSSSQPSSGRSQPSSSGGSGSGSGGSSGSSGRTARPRSPGR